MRTLLRILVCLAMFGAVAACPRGIVQAEPVPASAESFSIIVLPDTQFYSESYPETYMAQTRWIRQRAEPDNVKFVIHLGDIVQNPDEPQEWEVADRAHRLLDGVVPYSVLEPTVTTELPLCGDSTVP